MIKQQLINAVISSSVSFLISGVVLYYLRKYFDKKLSVNEQKAAQRRRERQRLNVLEQRYRRAQGRLLFWMCDAIVKGREHANGDLEKSRVDFTEAEEELKNYEQELLAARADENLTDG